MTVDIEAREKAYWVFCRCLVEFHQSTTMINLWHLTILEYDFFQIQRDMFVVCLRPKVP